MFYRPRRRPSGMQVTIRALGKDLSVKVLDVSQTGVKVAIPDGLPEGAAAMLVTPRFQVGATVRWSQAGKVGLTLDRKLGSGEQTELSGMSWGI